MIAIGLALISYGAVVVWMDFAITGIVLGGAFVAVGIAVVLGKRWSRFLVYALALYVSGSWIYLVWFQYSSGRVPYESAMHHFLGLLPGLLLLAACAGFSYVVHNRLGKNT